VELQPHGAALLRGAGAITAEDRYGADTLRKSRVGATRLFLWHRSATGRETKNREKIKQLLEKIKQFAESP
jgi:hypothetical protein